MPYDHYPKITPNGQGMATFERRGKRWRVQLYVNGIRESATFDTKARAAAWALERTGSLSGSRTQVHTLGDALRRYGEEVSPTKAGARWELLRLEAMGRDPIAKRSMAELQAADVAELRDRRLKSVTGATVLREFNLLRSVIEVARRDWQWISVNPMRDVRKPQAPPSRKRRITGEEIASVELASGLGEGLVADTAMQRTGLAFLFAIETACRAGEIIGMHADDVHVHERFVHLPRTKNGESRDVPLSTRAVEILEIVMARHQETVFDLNGPTRDVMFRRITKAAQLTNLHFHDSRAEAIWRLSKKLDVLQLARAIGHRDIKSLMLYYNESASELAKRLD